MTLKQYTPFQSKKNATYHGDPNGSYIMAEDINSIQDAVSQLEQVIGLNDNELSLTERIERVSSNAALRADKFVVYKGDPLVAYETLDEAIHSFSFVDHLVLKKQDDGGFTDFLAEIIAARTHVYGYIDCTSTIPLSLIQLDIEWWRTQGAVGIFLANFDYASGNTRTRQNDIILAAQERGMRAIVTGSMNDLLFNAENPLNPEWTPLGLTSKDGYYMEDVFYNNSLKKPYADSLALAKDLIRAKESLGISIYLADRANGLASATQAIYEHGHSLALLFGLDGYFVNRTDEYELNDPIRYHAWAPFLGSWSDANITLVETLTDVRRRTSFGEIIYMKATNTVAFTGLTIPPELLQWKDNSLPGSVLKDKSIPDSKIQSYDGDRLIEGINTTATGRKISLSKLELANLQDLSGYITVEGLSANVIEAINARIENLDVNNAVINSAIIGTLQAEHITASVIEAINITTGHLEAGSAYIHGAVIDDLDAGVIRSGDIDTDRLSAHVVTAINLNAGHAEIESAVIGELKADRIQASVVDAINLYAQSAVLDKAVIESAAIGELQATHIEASVIDAINANIGTAHIDKAVIPELDAEHIKSSVIDALEANIGSATIDNALIGELEAKHIQASVIDAVNANIGEAHIDKAIIPELEAGHIQASVIDAVNANIGFAHIDKAVIPELESEHIQAAVIDALKANIGVAVIDNALIGELDATKIQTSVIDAINANIGTAHINKAIIPELDAEHITSSVIEAVNIAAGHVEAGSAYIHGAIIDNIDASSISTGSLDADLIKANVVEAINANIGNAVIDSAAIGELTAQHMQAGVISAINLYSESATVGKITINSAAIGELSADSIKTNVIEAINANITFATIDKAVIPELDADHIKSSVIEALEANIGSATINNALIGNLDATHIQSSVIEAINANVNFARIDKAVIPELDAEHIKASVIEALEANINIAKINSALIGELNVDSMTGKVIEAINLSATSAVIHGAKIKEATIESAHIVKGTITNAEIADATIKTANIELGAVTSAIIGEGQVKTINIATAAITDALIKNLSADKINAGTINSSLVKIEGDNGFLRLWGNRLQVFDDQPVPVERVSLGDVDGDGSLYGFRVRGADGTTVLYDEKGVYNEGITNGAITNPKIGNDAIDDRVIKAGSIYTKHLVADQILATHIASDQINTKHILAGSITAESGIIADLAVGRTKIANAAIGAAQIDNAVISNAHIKDLNADKINAGKIKAEFVEIGGGTTFAIGYNPSTINSNLRSDLNITSSLPTNITLSNEGIKATTDADPTKYVLLNQNGLYVHGGAIIIDGGLSKDNIDTSLTDAWDRASQFAENMANDNIVTPSEKTVLQRDWQAWKSEYASLLAQADWYWPDNSTAPFAKTDYIDKYGQLREYLTALPDSNNQYPILYSGTMLKDSYVDGTVLNDKIDNYKTASFRLQQELGIAAKSAADAAQQNVDDVENNIVYKLEIISSNGNQFKNGQINTALEARVWHGSTEVTSQFPDYKFKWTRVSEDSAGDTTWNQNHFSGMRVIQITRDDVNVRATFNCELLE